MQCELALDIADRATVALQVAPARTAGRIVSEELVVESDGRALTPDEIGVDHGGRIHVVAAASGRLTVRYDAVVEPWTTPQAVTDRDRLVYLRQSRYCPSDRLDGFALDEFGPVTDVATSAQRVAAWVFERLAYEPGSSGPLDTAIDTLLGGRGVCRDFAHLTVALCRALSIPARLAAVYAPGLSPMDFHAVAEVATGDRWLVVDSTRLAPRPSLVRIATGRDAADTSFCATVEGDVELVSCEVGAVTAGDLPWDDHAAPAHLA